MPAPRRRLFLAAQLVAGALLVFFIGRDLAGQWATLRAQRLEIDVRVLPILVSGMIVLATYALLVQVWRVLLASAGEHLAFWRAARIWSISNLWRYVPGKIWQIGAMTALAQRERVSPVSAAGTAVLSTILNIATGMALVLLLGSRWLDAWDPRAHSVALVLLVLAVAGLALMPYALPRLGDIAARVTGRAIALRSPPAWAVIMATVGNVLSWLLYGVAFLWLTRGLLGNATAPTWQYIGVFAASYVVGYLVLLLPGGVGPREAMMLWLLVSLGMMLEKQAVLVTVASRLWLTFLELVPGLVFLGIDRLRPPRPLQNSTSADVASRSS